MKTIAQSKIKISSVVFALLGVSYPLTVHLAITGGRPLIAFLILISLFLFLFKQWVSRLILGLLMVIVVLLAIIMPPDYGLLFLYLSPILINGGLAFIFGSSLRNGHTPLVTRFSILLREKPEPIVVNYTRRVTQLWTLFFVIISIESLLLALIAPIEVWSLFANGLNYVFALALFVSEYIFRIHHLDEIEHLSFPKFVRAITQLNINEVKE